MSSESFLAAPRGPIATSLLALFGDFRPRVPSPTETQVPSADREQTCGSPVFASTSVHSCYEPTADSSRQITARNAFLHACSASNYRDQLQP
jgi:hypothetical protein